MNFWFQDPAKLAFYSALLRAVPGKNTEKGWWQKDLDDATWLPVKLVIGGASSPSGGSALDSSAAVAELTEPSEIMVFCGALEALEQQQVDVEAGVTKPEFFTALGLKLQGLGLGAKFNEFDDPSILKLSPSVAVKFDAHPAGRPLLTFSEMRRVWLRRLAVALYANARLWPWKLEQLSRDDLNLLLAFRPRSDGYIEEPQPLTQHQALYCDDFASAQEIWRREDEAFHPYSDPAKGQIYHFMWLWDPNPLYALNLALLATGAMPAQSRNDAILSATRLIVDWRIRRSLFQPQFDQNKQKYVYSCPQWSGKFGPFHGPHGSLFPQYDVGKRTLPVGSLEGLMRGAPAQANDGVVIDRHADCKVMAPFLVSMLRALNVPSRAGISKICDLEWNDRLQYAGADGSTQPLGTSGTDPCGVTLDFAKPPMPTGDNYFSFVWSNGVAGLSLGKDSAYYQPVGAEAKMLNDFDGFDGATACHAIAASLHRWVVASSEHAGCFGLYHATYLNSEHGTQYLRHGREARLWLPASDFLVLMQATALLQRSTLEKNPSALARGKTASAKAGQFDQGMPQVSVVTGDTLAYKFEDGWSGGTELVPLIDVQTAVLKASYLHLARRFELYLSFCLGALTVEEPEDRVRLASYLFPWAATMATTIVTAQAAGKCTPEGILSPPFRQRVADLLLRAELHEFWGQVNSGQSPAAPDDYPIESYGPAPEKKKWQTVAVPGQWAVADSIPLNVHILPLELDPRKQWSKTGRLWCLDESVVGALVLYFRLRAFYIAGGTTTAHQVSAGGWP